MKCQYCQENEAVNSFLISYPGGSQEVHLCEECTRKAQRYYQMAQQANPGTALGPRNQAAQRKVGNIPFPENAGGGIRHRRHMNMLRARLDEAVRQEHYEEAARLRDEIAAAQKDVYAR